jgi:hypothetical protein
MDPRAVLRALHWTAPVFTSAPSCHDSLNRQFLLIMHQDQPLVGKSSSLFSIAFGVSDIARRELKFSLKQWAKPGRYHLLPPVRAILESEINRLRDHGSDNITQLVILYFGGEGCAASVKDF